MVGSSADAARGQGPRAISAAAVTYLVLSIGFGVATVVTLASLACDGELPITPGGSDHCSRLDSMHP
jgi:hypothetical protein